MLESVGASHRLPRLLLFDLGNVLVGLRPLEKVIPFESLLRKPGWDSSRIESEVKAFRASPVFDRYERGLATAAEFWDSLRARFEVNLPDAELQACYREILGEEVPGMLALVSDLKQRGVRAAGLTDTSPVHLEVLCRYPAVRALEAVIASCDTGLKKPDPEAFREALRRLGVTAGDVLYTDDVQANVDGARKAGIRAELFRGPAALREMLGLDAKRSQACPGS
jgi:HAD superfamily hydrolase (TIGR01509 family)